MDSEELRNMLEDTGKSFRRYQEKKEDEKTGRGSRGQMEEGKLREANAWEEGEEEMEEEEEEGEGEDEDEDEEREVIKGEGKREEEEGGEEEDIPLTAPEKQQRIADLLAEIARLKALKEQTSIDASVTPPTPSVVTLGVGGGGSRGAMGLRKAAAGEEEEEEDGERGEVSRSEGGGGGGEAGAQDSELEGLIGAETEVVLADAQFTCFTGTKCKLYICIYIYIYIYTLCSLMLSLLALLVQNLSYIYAYIGCAC
jgi:hypothetical protein